MSKFMGIASSSLVAATLAAVAGCSSSTTGRVASAVATEQTSTASTTSATGTGLSSASPTALSTVSATASVPGQTSAPSMSPSGAAPQGADGDTPFPGIWDITSWQQYAAVQQSVEQGHQPWLRDPALVVDAWAHQWNPAPPVVRITADEFQVTQPGTTTVYTIRGTRPVSTGPAPIWVITSITHS